MAASDVQHVKPERLRFVGQGDCEVLFLLLYGITSRGGSVCYERFGSLLRTLATDKEYADREIRALGQRYINHMLAMTAERLETKGAIAAELAWRDWQIECERDVRERLEARLAALTQRVETDSKDAARYRWMRASGGLRLPACIGELAPGYDYDAGIDARIALETRTALPKEPR